MNKRVKKKHTITKEDATCAVNTIIDYAIQNGHPISYPNTTTCGRFINIWVCKNVEVEVTTSCSDLNECLESIINFRRNNK